MAAHTTTAAVKTTRNQSGDQPAHKYILILAEIILWAALKRNQIDLIVSEEMRLPPYCAAEEVRAVRTLFGAFRHVNWH